MSQGNGSSKETHSNHQVVSFNEARANKLEEKRRKTERLFFKNLMSVYSVIQGKSLIPVEFIDLSEEGCSFQVPYDPTSAWPEKLEHLPIRIYFTQNTYLELNVTVKNTRQALENQKRFVRYGCMIDTTTQSYETYVQFVRFMKSYAEQSHKDLGNVTVFYL